MPELLIFPINFLLSGNGKYRENWSPRPELPTSDDRNFRKPAPIVHSHPRPPPSSVVACHPSVCHDSPRRLKPSSSASNATTAVYTAARINRSRLQEASAEIKLGN